MEGRNKGAKLCMQACSLAITKHQRHSCRKQRAALPDLALVHPSRRASPPRLPHRCRLAAVPLLKRSLALHMTVESSRPPQGAAVLHSLPLFVGIVHLCGSTLSLCSLHCYRLCSLTVAQRFRQPLVMVPAVLLAAADELDLRASCLGWQLGGRSSPTIQALLAGVLTDACAASGAHQVTLYHPPAPGLLFWRQKQAEAMHLLAQLQHSAVGHG